MLGLRSRPSRSQPLEGDTAKGPRPPAPWPCSPGPAHPAAPRPRPPALGHGPPLPRLLRVCRVAPAPSPPAPPRCRPSPAPAPAAPPLRLPGGLRPQGVCLAAAPTFLPTCSHPPRWGLHCHVVTFPSIRDCCPPLLSPSPLLRHALIRRAEEAASGFSVGSGLSCSAGARQHLEERRGASGVLLVS